MTPKTIFKPNQHSHFLLMIQNSIDPLTIPTQAPFSRKTSTTFVMEFNQNKCMTMHISRKKLSSHTRYTLDGQPLKQVAHISDLGITVSSDLSWSRHIEITAAKANKTLGLIKRICRDIHDPTTRRFLYCSLVKPKLEYASNVWSPNTIKYRSIIENVQRRATKFILNYPKDMPYPERLVETNLLPLEFRREMSDLQLLHKAKMGLISMDINKYLSIHEPGYKSRSNYNVNNFHFVLKHKQNYFKNLFFVRSASLWNNLPIELKSHVSISIFRNGLQRYYKAKLPLYCPPGSV